MTRNQLLIVLGLAVMIGATTLTRPKWKSARNADKYLPLLHAAENEYRIPRDLLARLAYQESRFRDDIVTGKTKSSAGAVGIMQIVPRWHPGVDPLNVREAILYAAHYLRQLFDRFGNWKRALAAYNAGPGNVADFVYGTNHTGNNPELIKNSLPPFPETVAYVHEITSDVPV